MKLLSFVVMLAGLIALGATPGCSAKQIESDVTSVLAGANKLNSLISEASNILSVIEEAASVFFSLRPDPAAQQLFSAADQDVRLSLDAVGKSLAGVQDLSDAKLDAAFADFRAAYAKLDALVKQLGINALKNGKAAAFPTPRAANPILPIVVMK